MVQGTMNQEVPTTKKKEVPTLGHLLTVLGQCSLGTVLKKSWDSAVLGQYQRSLGTVQSWDSTEEVLGQCSLRTVPKKSWDSAVLGQYQRSLGTVVLGH